MKGLLMDRHALLVKKLDGFGRLLEINSRISGTRHFESLLKEVMQEGKSLMESEACSLMLLDAERGELYFDELASQRDEKLKEMRVPLGKGIAGHVAQSGETLLVENVQEDERFYKRIDDESGFVSRCILCVPLRVHETIIGIIEAINPVGRSSFDEVDICVFEEFSRLAAIAIDKVQTAKMMLEQKRLEFDLDIARKIQQNFLPDDPELPGRSMVFARSIPAREIGGDFFDFFALDENRTGILIGDVSGKGVSAALYMVKLMSDFRWHALAKQDIRETFRTVNRLFFETNKTGMFATIVYMVYDRSTRVLEYMNGGHLPFLIREQNGGDVTFISDGKCTALGVFRDVEPELGELVLGEEQNIILITDGITEAVNPSGEEFGMLRLLRILKKPLPREKLGPSILDEVTAYTDSREHHDDITVVVI